MAQAVNITDKDGGLVVELDPDGRLPIHQLTRVSGDVFIGNGDVASILANSAIEHGQDFMSRVLNVEGCKAINVAGYATGGLAACAKDVEFDFVTSIDGTNWDTVPYATLRVAMSGDNAVQGGAVLDVDGAREIRLKSIFNTEVVGGRTATSVNCRYNKRF